MVSSTPHVSGSGLGMLVVICGRIICIRRIAVILALVKVRKGFAYILEHYLWCNAAKFEAMDLD